MTRTRESQRRMSLAEYLAFEDTSPLKHEFVAGEVYTMSGAGEGELVALPFDTQLSLSEIYDDVLMPPLGVKENEWELSDDEDE